MSATTASAAAAGGRPPPPQPNASGGRAGRRQAPSARAAAWCRAHLSSLALACLAGGAFALGPSLGGVVRPAFVAGCGLVGWLAWREGAGRHLQASIILFALSPFLRRVVDLGAGYEPAGTMLIGPILTLLVPTVELRLLLRRDGLRWDETVAPYLVVGGCILYAALLALAQGEFMQAASGALKWTAPLLYGLWLSQHGDPDGELAQAAARAFMVVLPAVGLYGVLQYVDPPAWDRFWMLYTPINTIGQPEPYQVRVYSTMNSPASFATFAVCGLLLFGVLRPGWQAGLLALPVSLGLLLSLYRTAWIALLAGMAFCFLFGATRRRSAVVAALLAAAVVVAATISPFGEVIADRLGTLGEGSQDGSGQERLGEFLILLAQPGSVLWGWGFTTTDAGTAGAMPIDGMLIANWVAMGIPFGMVCLAAIVWAAGQALAAVRRDPRPPQVALGAVVAGSLAQVPLASITSGELGFLFWTCAGLAVAGGRRYVGGRAAQPAARVPALPY